MNYFYKKIIYIIILIFASIIPVFASNTDILSKIENDLFGFDYTNDSSQNRVSRLEKTIYGKVSSGNLDKRIKQLSGDISADVIGLEIPASKDTFLAEEEREDSTVNYPIVDEIEKKIFNKTYKERDLHTRIVTIEKKLFGKIYDIDDYSKRMDRIKEKVMPEALAQSDDFENENKKRFDDNSISGYELSSNGLSRYKMPFGQRKYTRPYTNYGDYNGFSGFNNFDNGNNLNDDLTQMEYDMFGTEFSNDDTQSRIKRLNSVNKARKSSRKYDSQKFSQHMSTAMEIGAMILMILAMVL